MLRILFSRLGKPHIGSPKAFSFNVALDQRSRRGHHGARRTVKECAVLQHHRWHAPASCQGGGRSLRLHLTQLYDDSKSLSEAPSPSLVTRGRLELTALQRVGLLRPGQADPQVHQEGTAPLPAPRPTQMKIAGINMTYEGLIRGIQQVEELERNGRTSRTSGSLLMVVTFTTCPSATAPGSTKGPGRRRSSGSASPTPARCRSATWPRGSAVSTSRRWRRCSPRCSRPSTCSWRSGSAYLSTGRRARCPAARRSASRSSATSAPAHRRHLRLHASPPSACTYDIQRMNDLPPRLRDKGNTGAVAEHKPETIAIADHVVHLGPGAGTAGGTVCFEGTVGGLRTGGTITGRHFDDRAVAQEYARSPRGRREIRGARTTTGRASTSTSRWCSPSTHWPWAPGRARSVHGSIPAGRRGRGVGRPGRDPLQYAQQPGERHLDRRPDPARRSPRSTA